MLRFLPVSTADPMAGWGVDQEFYPESVLVCRLGWSNASGGELFWQEEQSVEEFLEMLALRLHALDKYPGDDAFAEQAPLVTLKEILGRALEANRLGKGSNLRKIVPRGHPTAEISSMNGTNPAQIRRAGLWV